MVLGFADAVLSEMEDRGREHRSGMAVANALDEVLERADTARGDDRHADAVGDRASERDVEALAGAVAIHRGQQNLARAERDDFLRIGKGVEPGRIAAPMGEDLPL